MNHISWLLKQGIAALRVISSSTPGVCLVAAAGGVLLHVYLKGELRLALAGCGGVLQQELYDVWTLFVSAEVAFVDHVHDAGEHVSRAAAKAD